MNKKQKRLKTEMTIFALFVFVFLGVILVTEKSSGLLIPKIEKKFNTYIKEKYNNLKLNKSKITYKSYTYTMKLTDKRNKDHYFYLYYKDKKITDTYKKDYVEAKDFIKKTEKKINKNINNITNSKYKVKINKNLNDFTEEVQTLLIESKTPEQIKIYNLEKSFKVNNYNANEIYNKINNTITILESNKIHPKTYSFIITDKNDITKSIKIYNIQYTDMNNNNIINIINDIINNNNSILLKSTNIKYKNLN